MLEALEKSIYAEAGGAKYLFDGLDVEAELVEGVTYPYHEGHTCMDSGRPRDDDASLTAPAIPP